MGNRTRAPEIKVCYIFMEEAHIKPRSYNSLLRKQLSKIPRFTLFLALLVVVELQLKDDAMFPTASLFICVCCSLLWTPLYINSLICVCPEQGDFDLRLRHSRSYNSVNSFQEVITIAFPATLHLYNKLSFEVLFWALECLPGCFLWVWNLISVGDSAQRVVEYWWKAHSLLMCFFSAGLFDSSRVRSLTSVWLQGRQRRTLASVGFQIEQDLLNTIYHIGFGETQIIIVCASASSFCLPSKTFFPRPDCPQTCLPLKWKVSSTWLLISVNYTIFHMEEAIPTESWWSFPLKVKCNNRNNIWFDAMLIRLFKSSDPSHLCTMFIC